jgi:hypothetical protein
MNLVTPKAGAKQQLLFNKPASVNLLLKTQYSADRINHFFDKSTKLLDNKIG